MASASDFTLSEATLHLGFPDLQKGNSIYLKKQKMYGTLNLK